MTRTTPQPCGLPDAELVAAAQRGDKRAFVDIVARYQATVCGIALGILGDFAASEDAAQEAFVTAWSRIGDLREPEKLRAWLVQIARNAALAHLRRSRGTTLEEVREDLADEQQQAPDEIAAHAEEAALVRGALAQLPANYRLPLVLYYRQEQSVREVAGTLGLSEDVVKQRLARGREMLRERVATLVETSLRCSQPGAMFTVAVAAAIGALMAPSAVAGTTFAAAASLPAGSSASAAASSASTSTTTSLATAMTVSKTSLAAAALVAAACLPLGYAVHFGADRQATPVRPATTDATSRATSTPKPDFSDSSLFAEWRRLHDEHGSDAAAMPVLFQAIAGIPDSFRRQAFRAALVSEWGQVDPAGGLDFFLRKDADADAARQLFRDWLARDPQAAVAKLSTCGSAGDALTVDLLSDIARKAPDQIPIIAARLPENRDPWKRPVTDAFAILAERDPTKARAAAEALSGPHRNEALAGVAKAWGERDFEGALAWAKGLPEGTDYNTIIGSALLGLASTDVIAALEKSSLVPPGGRAGYFADTMGAKLMRAAGDENFNTLTEWLRDHPGKIGAEETFGLTDAVARRLDADPVAFLDEQLAKGTLGCLDGPLGSVLLNSKPQIAKVWEWLKTHPETPELKRLRDQVLNAAGWQNPELSLAIAKDLPNTAEGVQQMSVIARSLLNGGSMFERVDGLLAETSGPMRSELLGTAFSFLTFENLDDPQKWWGRLGELPGGSQPVAMRTLATAWTMQDPETAAQWAQQLPADGYRSEALQGVAFTWAKRDSQAAAEWIGQLPSGPDRDTGANMLVEEIAANWPDEAWQWAVNIGDESMRMVSMKKALGVMAGRDRGKAMDWISGSQLPEKDKRALRQSLDAGGIH